jgi:hypothetical protein
MRNEMFELIRADFRAIEDKEELCVTKEVESLIHLQSIEGHAHNGHSLFHKKRFVDITMGEICKALGWDPAQIRAKRQVFIDEVKEWVEEARTGRPRKQLVNDNGDPLFRVEFLARHEVDTELVLKGIYYGGSRDNYEVRKRAEKLYGLRIGGGECYAVDTRVMKQMGLNGDVIAHGSYASKIAEWKQKGLIVAEPEKINDDGPIQYIYIRHEEGPGHSDDLAMMFAGMLCGYDAAFGAFLADAIDTFEKFSGYFQDQDQILSDSIAKDFPNLDLNEDTLLQLAQLATVPEAMEDELPDSSMRYFLRKDRRFHICPFENHLNFLAGKATVNVPVGIGRTPANELYEYIRSVSAKAVGAKLQPTTIPAKESGMIGQLLDRKVSILPETASLEEIANAMVASDEDFVIITGKDGKLLGVVHAHDLVGFMAR